LYLPDEQLTSTQVTSSRQVRSGIRYYSIGGITIAARASTGQVNYLAGNQQGTDTLALNARTRSITRRYYDPYGNPIGAAPASWPGTRGFVGGTTDPATGLTNLGAREYNPATGAFITTDPIQDPQDPQDLNPYAYAADNPATLADPTGLTECTPSPGYPCVSDNPPPPGSAGSGNSGCVANPSACTPGTSTGTGTGSTGEGSGSGQAPGSGILPPQARPAYAIFYASYQPANPYLTSASPQYTLDAVEAFCAQNQGLCTTGLAQAIFDKYEGLGAMAYGIFGFAMAGVSSGEAGDDIAGGNEHETALNEAAEQDLTQLQASFVVASNGEVTYNGENGSLKPFNEQIERSAELQEALENLQTASQDAGTVANAGVDVARGPAATGTVQPPVLSSPAYAPPVPAGLPDLSTAIPAIVMSGAAVWMAAQYWWNVWFG
jgi:RHS repeat-associated protein